MNDQKKETLLRIKEVSARTGLPKSTIYDLIKRGEFPASIQLFGRCVAWQESQVQEWINSRISATQQVKTA